MSNTHRGEILEISETKAVADKFQKRRFVVDQVFSGQYGVSHNPVPFFLIQEKCGMIDEFNVGQHVTVHFDVNSRPWIDKETQEHKLDREGERAYFVEIRAWKIEPVVDQAAEPQAEAQSDPVNDPVNDLDGKVEQFRDSSSDDVGSTDDGPDDLPF